MSQPTASTIAQEELAGPVITDEQIVKGFANDRPRAVTLALKKYKQYLWGRAADWAVRQDAEDILQDLAVNLLKTKTLPERNLRAYLLYRLRSCVAAHRRKQETREKHENAYSEKDALTHPEDLREARGQSLLYRLIDDRQRGQLSTFERALVLDDLANNFPAAEKQAKKFATTAGYIDQLRLQYKSKLRRAFDAQKLDGTS